MPGAREVLSFVLETDASKAIKGFEQAEKSADSLGTTMTKVGAVVGAAGLAVGAGLYGTVKQFEQAEAASAKFETSVRGMGSNIDTKAIKRLATELQQVSTVTNDQVTAAARWGAVYGLTTDQLEELLRVAVDLSAQTGKSLDVVTKALAKAASGGSYTALTKLGLTFDETAFKADAFGTTIAEATAFAGGAAAKQVDTMTGQLTRLGNNWDDVKEQIGAGANEVFEPLARAGADLTENLAKANPALLQTAGHMSALGSVAMTAFGGLASVGGQIVNLREGLGPLANKLRDAEGGLTNLGKAAGIAGGVIAGLAAVDVAAGVINTIAGYSGKAEDALNRLTVASAKAGKGVRGAGTDAVAAFADLASNQPLSLATAWESWGEQVRISVGGKETIASVEDADKAFESLLDQDPTLAREFLKSFEDFTGTMDESAAGFDTNTSQIKVWKEQLKNSTEATDALADANDDLAESSETASQGFKKLNDLARAQIDPFFALADANKKLNEAHWEVIAAQAEHGKGSAEYAAALRNAGAAALDMDAATQGLAAAVKDGTTSYPQAIARLEELGKSAGLSEDEVAGLKWQVFLYSKQVQDATGQTLDLDTDPAIEALKRLAAEMFSTKGALARLKTGFGYGLGGLGGVPGVQSAPSSAAMATPMAATGPTGSVSHVTINLPPGTPTSRTLSELRRYRRGGGDMSGLIDSIVAVR
jgi:hypothetical protein